MLLGSAESRLTVQRTMARAAAGHGVSVMVRGPHSSGVSTVLAHAEKLASTAISVTATDSTASTRPTSQAATAATPPAGTAVSGVPWLVLSARAVPEEAAIGGAALQPLLSQLLTEVGDQLPEAPRVALQAAVGLRAAAQGEVPLPMAVLQALQLAATRRAVLVTVDDVQWADPSSAAVLRFVCRRLSRAAVCMVLAAHVEAAAEDQAVGDVPPGAGLLGFEVDDVVVLPPLGHVAALGLIRERLPELDPLQAEVLVELAAGLPGRLVDLAELQRTSTDGQLALAGAQLPSVVRTRQRLTRASPSTRTALLLRGLVQEHSALPLWPEVLRRLHAEADPNSTVDRPDPPVDLSVDLSVGWGVNELSGGRPDGLVGQASGSVPIDTRDPLLEALAVARADPVQVQRAHQQWAHVLDQAASESVVTGDQPGEERLRLAAEAARHQELAQQHHSEAARADTARAEALADLARRLHSIDVVRSGQTYERAASLHEDQYVRAELIFEGAVAAWVCGRIAHAHAQARLAQELLHTLGTRPSAKIEAASDVEPSTAAAGASTSARDPDHASHLAGPGQASDAAHAALAAQARWHAVVALAGGDATAAVEHLQDAVLQAVASLRSAAAPRGRGEVAASDQTTSDQTTQSGRPATPAPDPRPDTREMPSAAVDALMASAAALALVMGRRSRSVTALDAAAWALPARLSAQLSSIAQLTRPWRDTVPLTQQRALTDALAALATSNLPVLRWTTDAALTLGRTRQVVQLCRARRHTVPDHGPAAVDVHLALGSCALHEDGTDSAGQHLERAAHALRWAPAKLADIALVHQQLVCLRSAGLDPSSSSSSSSHEPRTPMVTAAVTASSVPGAVGAPALSTSSELAGAVWARAHRHRLQGRFDRAADELQALWPTSASPATSSRGVQNADGEPASAGALMYAMPFIYAVHSAVERAYRREQLAQVAEQVSAWAEGSGAPQALSSHLLCQAVTTTDPQRQQQLLSEAVRAADSPVHAGVAQLAWGMALRRQRRSVQAREPLQAAVDAFEAKGMAAFAALARRELHATAPLRPARPLGSRVLTAQEGAVAVLAASGMSNADIAASLGISSRTVAHHLQRVYAKLQIAGRHALATSLEARQGES